MFECLELASKVVKESGLLDDVMVRNEFNGMCKEKCVHDMYKEAYLWVKIKLSLQQL